MQTRLPASFNAPTQQVMSLRRGDVFEQKAPEMLPNDYELDVDVDFYSIFQNVPRLALRVAPDFQNPAEDDAIVLYMSDRYDVRIKQACILLQSDVSTAGDFISAQGGIEVSQRVTLPQFLVQLYSFARVFRTAAYGVSGVNARPDSVDSAGNYVSGAAGIVYCNSTFIQTCRNALHASYQPADTTPDSNYVKLCEAVETVFRGDNFHSGAIMQLFQRSRVGPKILGEPDRPIENTLQGRLFDIGSVSTAGSRDLACIVNYYENIDTRDRDVDSVGDSLVGRQLGARILVTLAIDFCGLYESLVGELQLDEWLETKAFREMVGSTVNVHPDIPADAKGTCLVGLYAARLLYYARYWANTRLPATTPVDSVATTPPISTDLRLWSVSVASTCAIPTHLSVLDIDKLYYGFMVRSADSPVDVAGTALDNPMVMASEFMFDTVTGKWKVYPNGYVSISGGGLQAADFLTSSMSATTVRYIADPSLNCPNVVQRQWRFVPGDEIIQRYLLISNTDSSTGTSRKVTSLAIRFHHQEVVMGALRLFESDGTVNASLSTDVGEQTVQLSLIDQVLPSGRVGTISYSIAADQTWTGDLASDVSLRPTIADGVLTVPQSALPATNSFVVRATMTSSPTTLVPTVIEDYTLSFQGINTTAPNPTQWLSFTAANQASRQINTQYAVAANMEWSFTTGSPSDEAYTLGLCNAGSAGSTYLTPGGGVTWTLVGVDSSKSDIRLNASTLIVGSGAWPVQSTFTIQAVADYSIAQGYGSRTYNYSFTIYRTMDTNSIVSISLVPNDTSGLKTFAGGNPVLSASDVAGYTRVITKSITTTPTEFTFLSRWPTSDTNSTPIGYYQGIAQNVVLRLNSLSFQTEKGGFRYSISSAYATISNDGDLTILKDYLYTNGFFDVVVSQNAGYGYNSATASTFRILLAQYPYTSDIVSMSLTPSTSSISPLVYTSGTNNVFQHPTTTRTYTLTVADSDDQRPLSSIPVFSTSQTYTDARALSISESGLVLTVPAWSDPSNAGVFTLAIGERTGPPGFRVNGRSFGFKVPKGVDMGNLQLAWSTLISNAIPSILGGQIFTLSQTVYVRPDDYVGSVTYTIRSDQTWPGDLNADSRLRPTITTDGKLNVPQCSMANTNNFKVRATLSADQTTTLTPETYKDYTLYFPGVYLNFTPTQYLKLTADTNTRPIDGLYASTNTAVVVWSTSTGYPTAEVYTVSLADSATASPLYISPASVAWDLLDSTGLGLTYSTGKLTIASGLWTSLTFKLQAVATYSAVTGYGQRTYDFKFSIDRTRMDGEIPTQQLALGAVSPARTITTKYPAANVDAVPWVSTGSTTAEVYDLALEGGGTTSMSPVSISWSLVDSLGNALSITSSCLTVASGSYGNPTDPMIFKIRAVATYTAAQGHGVLTYDFMFSIYRTMVSNAITSLSLVPNTTSGLYTFASGNPELTSTDVTTYTRSILSSSSRNITLLSKWTPSNTEIGYYQKSASDITLQLAGASSQTANGGLTYSFSSSYSSPPAALVGGLLTIYSAYIYTEGYIDVKVAQAAGYGYYAADVTNFRLTLKTKPYNIKFRSLTLSPYSPAGLDLIYYTSPGTLVQTVSFSRQTVALVYDLVVHFETGTPAITYTNTHIVQGKYASLDGYNRLRLLAYNPITDNNFTIDINTSALGFQSETYKFVFNTPGGDPVGHLRAEGVSGSIEPNARPTGTLGSPIHHNYAYDGLRLSANSNQIFRFDGEKLWHVRSGLCIIPNPNNPYYNAMQLGQPGTGRLGNFQMGPDGYLLHGDLGVYMGVTTDGDGRGGYLVPTTYIFLGQPVQRSKFYFLVNYDTVF